MGFAGRASEAKRMSEVHVLIPHQEKSNMTALEYIMARLGIKEEGQTMAEYALILALIVVAVIAAMSPMGTKIAGIFTKVTANV